MDATQTHRVREEITQLMMDGERIPKIGELIVRYAPHRPQANGNGGLEIVVRWLLPPSSAEVVAAKQLHPTSIGHECVVHEQIDICA